MRRLFHLIRYEWLLHFFYILTNWLPDNVFFIRLRGRLYGLCIGSCGKRFGVGRNVTFFNPSNIHIGQDVYIAYGCWMNGAGGIQIEDEVLLGPYCVLASSNHRFDAERKSFRFAKGSQDKITIGRGSWLAAHVTVTAGVNISAPTLVAANSVVSKTTRSSTLVGGVPAKEIKEI